MKMKSESVWKNDEIKILLLNIQLGDTLRKTNGLHIPLNVQAG